VSPDAERVAALDLLRGLLMVVMALDHANLFIAHAHSSGEFWAGALPRYPDTLAFVTRAVTHLCAPGFFMLMGASMVLFAEARRRAGWTEGAIARHFVARGAILVLLQLTLENAAWALGPGSSAHPPGAAAAGGLLVFHFGVLYALGACMTIAGALLLRAGPAAWAATALASLVATNFLLPDPAHADVACAWWLRLLLVPGRTGIMQVYYPAIPWLVPTCLGLWLGRALGRDALGALRRAPLWGAAALAAFFALRATTAAGSIRAIEGTGAAAFLALTKYPPAATFLLATLGADLLLLGGLARARAVAALAPLLVFGRSALFFYVAHLWLYALLGLAFRPAGTGIPGMFPVWLLGLVLLYPLCLAWARFKRTRAPDSLWRLF